MSCPTCGRWGGNHTRWCLARRALPWGVLVLAIALTALAAAGCTITCRFGPPDERATSATKERP